PLFSDTRPAPPGGRRAGSSTRPGRYGSSRRLPGEALPLAHELLDAPRDRLLLRGELGDLCPVPTRIFAERGAHRRELRLAGRDELLELLHPALALLALPSSGPVCLVGRRPLRRRARRELGLLRCALLVVALLRRR